MQLKAANYIALLKQFYNGALTFQYSTNGGISWTDLLRFDETNNSASFIGSIYEQGTMLEDKYLKQKEGCLVEFIKSTFTKTDYSNGYGVNHICSWAICLEVNNSATWTDCYLGTISIKPYYIVRTVVVLQDTGKSIPLRIETNGKVYLEIKGVTPGTSGWIYGGITYYYA